MKTNFFSQLASLGSLQGTISITNDADNNILSVSFLPTPIGVNIDPAFKKLTSLNISAKPNEVDEVFFTRISNPIKETIAMFDNTASYLANKSRVEKETKKAKEEKETINKLEKELSTLLENPTDNKTKINKKVLALKAIDPINKIAQKALENTSQNKLFS